MAERTVAPLPMTVVIVTWNSADVLPACLESLSQAAPLPAEVVVVDNASADGSIALVRAWAARSPGRDDADHREPRQSWLRRWSEPGHRRWDTSVRVPGQPGHLSPPRHAQGAVCVAGGRTG